MGDLWSRPLRDLRKHFGERNEFLYDMLIEWPSDGWGWSPSDPAMDPDEYFDRLGMPPDWVMRMPHRYGGEERPIISREYERVRESGPFRMHIYYGRDRDAIGRFHEMTEGVVQCLTALPSGVALKDRDVARFLPIDEIFGPTPAQVWELLIHRLAWLETPSSPLRASRKTWSGKLVMDFGVDIPPHENGGGIVQRGASEVDDTRFPSYLPAALVSMAWGIVPSADDRRRRLASLRR